MNGYLLSVIGTVLLAALITAIAPEGKTSAVIKGIVRLVCILTIIAPVLRFFKTGDITEFTQEKGEEIFAENGIDADEDFIQYYCELRIRETESALERELSEKYRLSTDVRLQWSRMEESFDSIYSLDKIRIDRINVRVLENALEEVKEEVCEYLTKTYRSEVLIE